MLHKSRGVLGMSVGRRLELGGASNFRNCEFIKEIDWQTTQRNPAFIYITPAIQRLLRSKTV